MNIENREWIDAKEVFNVFDSYFKESLKMGDGRDRLIILGVISEIVTEIGKLSIISTTRIEHELLQLNERGGFI